MVNGALICRENNNMSLSCWASMKIENGLITDFSFKGMPRTEGDSWTSFFKKAKIGKEVSIKDVDWILSFNGHYNVYAKFTADN